jgi:hypothetical protein
MAKALYALATGQVNINDFLKLIKALPNVGFI